MRPLGVHGRVVRAARLVLLAGAVALTGASPALAHLTGSGAPGGGEHDHATPPSATAASRVGAAAGASTVAAATRPESLYDEALIPGLDSATDFAIAGNGDVYVALHDGDIYRYTRAAGSGTAYPRYDLTPQLVHRFQTTRQYDRGLVGIALDAQFDSGQRYLYALITRGSVDFNDNRPGGNPNGIRRTGAVVRIAVPASGAAQPSDLKTIVGADAPADVDSTCKPYTKGMAAEYGDTEAAPNGVELYFPDKDDGSGPNIFAVKNPLFTEANIYPDGNLATRADGAYDCIPSDGDTHGLGSIQSAPDGSLFISVGDATPFQTAQGGQFRTYNQESYVGKILRVDRNGRGVAGHPFCPTETDLTRVCTKLWAMGLRNAFRIQLLPPDGASGGSPVVAVGDVGDFSVERLKITHPGDNLGWPCWEGTYYNDRFANPTKSTAVTTGWGGPDLKPTDGRVSCELLTAGGRGTGAGVQPRADVKMPNLEYFHATAARPSGEGAAIVTGPQLVARPGTDPAVALPSSWTGSLLFGDFARGWLNRIAPDADDPGNADHDGGLRLPADEGRVPTVKTENTAGDTPDPLLDRIAERPAEADWYRLTSRQGPDGALWYLRYGGSSQGGGLVRLRTAPTAPAAIDQTYGQCKRIYGGNGAVTLVGADAGPGASYAWDISGDGLPDPGRTFRTTTISKADLNTTAYDARLTVKTSTSESTASCYLGRGQAPDLTITAPADGAQVVLGQPVVVTATRPANDRWVTEIDDDRLKWAAVTVHGSNHTHPLLDRTGATERVGTEDRMQFTVVPTVDHELGSYTRVRFFAPQSDPNLPQQTIRLYPKPVQVTFRSSPAGAPISISRSDTQLSSVDAAPGTIELAAGYAAESLAAAPSFFDGRGQRWAFRRWSDGFTRPARPWTVRATDGDAPVAEYVEQSDTPTPTAGPTATAEPVAPPAETPGAAGPPAPPAATGAPATPGATTTPGAPALPRPTTPLLPATALELREAPLTLSASATTKKARIRAMIDVGRTVDSSGLTIKAAVRAADCRWWSFGRRAFVTPKGSKKATSRKRRAATCRTPTSWKLTRSSGGGSVLTAEVALGAKLARGRYAVRLRVQRGKVVLAERVRSLVVK